MRRLYPTFSRKLAAVALPSSADVQRSCACGARAGVPFVARGHGTGLSGGALPVPGGLVIALARLNRVLDVDIPNQRVTVEPGVTNLDITKQVAPFGYYYAPDPSSQQVCSIGGNVAENSGGAHCLKYGFIVCITSSASKRCRFLTASSCTWAARWLTRRDRSSWGRLSFVKRTLRGCHERDGEDSAGGLETVQTLLAAFDSIDAGGAVIADIIGAGIIPAAEMMDSLAIRAAEAAVQPNFPDADTILIVELDGPAAEVTALFEIVVETCRRRGATTIQVAQTDDQRARIWRGRKAAFAAMGRLAELLRARIASCRARRPLKMNRIRAARSAIRSQNRQCLPRGGRQSAPAHLLRRADPGSGGLRCRGRRRDPVIASRLADRSRASTASVPINRNTCR